MNSRYGSGDPSGHTSAAVVLQPPTPPCQVRNQQLSKEAGELRLQNDETHAQLEAMQSSAASRAEVGMLYNCLCLPMIQYVPLHIEPACDMSLCVCPQVCTTLACVPMYTRPPPQKKNTTPHTLTHCS